MPAKRQQGGGKQAQACRFRYRAAVERLGQLEIDALRTSAHPADLEGAAFDPTWSAP